MLVNTDGTAIFVNNFAMDHVLGGFDLGSNMSSGSPCACESIELSKSGYSFSEVVSWSVVSFLSMV